MYNSVIIKQILLKFPRSDSANIQLAQQIRDNNIIFKVQTNNSYCSAQEYSKIQLR